MYKKICMVMAVVLSSSTQNVCSLAGKLDTTFNASGVQPGTVTTTIDNTIEQNVAQSIAIQQDGKIVTAGYVIVGGVGRFAVARFNINGTLDATFNASGVQPGTVSTTIENTAASNAAFSVAIQQDGKIVVAGFADIGGANRFAVARFKVDGTLDETFNPFPAPQPGTVTTTIENTAVSNNALSVAIQQDGRIVVAGSADIGGVGRFAVARFNVNGTLDTTFNPFPAPQPGTVSTTIENTAAVSVAQSVAIQQDGKIVAAGYAEIGGVNRFAVARFNINGTLDTTFNALGVQPGTVTTTIDNTAASNYAFSVAIQQDGKIVTAGYVDFGLNVIRFAVARFNTNGTLDTTFNASGVQPGTVSTTIENTTAVSVAFSVAIQQDGKIVAAGYAEINGVNRFAAARFLGSGFLGIATNNLCALRLIEKYGPRLTAQL